MKKGRYINKNLKGKEKGFTLIELLAVIIILAVIALIATPIILNVVAMVFAVMTYWRRN